VSTKTEVYYIRTMNNLTGRQLAVLANVTICAGVGAKATTSTAQFYIEEELDGNDVIAGAGVSLPPATEEIH
jgi:hypothetical protein